jgi:hypothetical protein
MLRKWTLVASATLLLLASVAVPAAGQADATVSDLNAIPGTRIDICVVGQGEVVSGLRYGRASEPGVVPAGTWTVQVRAAATGTCKGPKLLSKQVTLVGGTDYTFVYWKPTRSVALKVFENDLALPALTAVKLTMRHTAKAGPIDVWVWQKVVISPADEYDPTFDDLSKGTQAELPSLDARLTLIEAFPASPEAAWSYEYAYLALATDSIYEAYFIGDAKATFRIVLLGKAAVYAPAP